MGWKISLHSSLSTINSSSHYSIPESFNSSFYSLVSSICILQNQDPLGFESGHIWKKKWSNRKVFECLTSFDHVSHNIVTISNSTRLSVQSYLIARLRNQDQQTVTLFQKTSQGVCLYVHLAISNISPLRIFCNPLGCVGVITPPHSVLLVHFVVFSAWVEYRCIWPTGFEVSLQRLLRIYFRRRVYCTKCGFGSWYYC